MENKGIPDQGDIIWLNFNPSSGKEIIKTRPAFVLSRKIFNDHTGFAIVAPITSTIRQNKLEVVLHKNMRTKGAVLVYQLRSLDYQSRQAKIIERSHRNTIHQVMEIASLLVS